MSFEPRLPRIILILALASVAAVAGYGVLAGRTDAGPHYTTAAVKSGPLTSTVTAVGTINAMKLVQVGAEISGQIRELHADYNSVVAKGDVIARIAPENFRAQVDQAEAEREMAAARIHAAKVGLERAKADQLRAAAQEAVQRARRDGARAAAAQAGRDLARKAAQQGKGFVSPSDYEQAQLARDQAAAALAGTEAELRAQAALVQSAAAEVRAAEVAIRAAEAAHRQAAAALRKAEADLERTRITAPIDGIVIERSVDVGQTVASSLQTPTLFTIAESLRNLQVETYVDETDIGRVRVGQAASFTVGAFPDTTFAGEVIQVRQAPLVIQNVVTYMVIVSARNEAMKLMPGMTATVDIVSAHVENARLVPLAALRFTPPPNSPAHNLSANDSSAGNSASPPSGRAAAAEPPRDGTTSPARRGRVYKVAEDGTLLPVAVETGASDGAVTEIVDGQIEPGDTVAVGLRTAERRARWTLSLPKL